MNFDFGTGPTNASLIRVFGTAVSLMGSLFLQMGLMGSAVAQTAPYPNKSITMIVPFPPGGLADIVARPVAEAMSRELGQPVVIENKGGAGGGIGMGVAARSKPDGYTVLHCNIATNGIAPALYAKLPYEPLKDFEHVNLWVTFPLAMVVPASSPLKTTQCPLASSVMVAPGLSHRSSALPGSVTISTEL